jgi:hypothetical protein
MISKLAALCAFFTSTALAVPISLQTKLYDGSLSFKLQNSSALYYVPSPSKSASVGKYSVKTPKQLTVEVPFTVLVLNSTVIDESVIKKTLANYMEDDVYTEGFLDGG